MIRCIVAYAVAMTCLVGRVLSTDPVELKITEKNSLKPAAYKSEDLFKINLDQAVRDSKFVFLFAEALGEIELESSQSDGQEVQHVCTGQTTVTCIFNMTDMKALVDRPEGFRLKAKAISNPESEIRLAVYAGDYLILQNQTRQTVLLKDITTLDALVSFESASDTEKIRIQLKAHPKRDFASMETFLNFDKETFPTLEKHDIQFSHIDSFRSGFVSYKGEDDFCGNSKTCTYRLQIETDGISSFQFSVVQGQHREVIETEYRYFDKSNEDYSRIYKLNVPEEKFKNKDVKISLISISGSPNLYVNPEIVPEYSPMSIYKETGGVSKSIVIPWSERSNQLQKISVGFVNQTVYIMVQGSVKSTYYLKVQAVDADSPMEKLATGTKEQFFSAYGKVKNFKAAVKTVTSLHAIDTDLVKNQKVKISLHALNANVELMAYQWTPEFNRPLDLELYSSQKTSPSLKGFHSDTSTHNHKEITLEVDCNSKTSIGVTKLAGGLVEYLCIVDIGVYPMARSTDQTFGNATAPQSIFGTSYELSYEISGIHSLLYSNHMTVVNLLQDEERIFQYNLHQESSDSDSLSFIMQMAYGKVEMKISKAERNPCKATNESSVFSLVSMNNKFGIVKFGKGGYKIPTLKGSYYICLKSSGILSSLLVLPSPSIGASSLFTSMDAGLMHLTPNHNLIGEINSEQSTLQFIFNVNLDPNQEEVIMINVSPLHGNANYRITASNNGYEPRTDQSHWNVVGHTLTISSKDPLFKSKADYRVKISIPSNNEYRVRGSHRFTVSYSIGLKDVLLKEGLPYIGDFSNITREHRFRIEIPPGSKNLTILKSLVDHYYTAEGYFQSKGHEANATRFTISNFMGGQIFDEKQLNVSCPEMETKPCNVYLKVSSLLAASTYLLAYSIDNRPFTLHHNYGFFVPQSPVFGNYRMHFIYHLPTIKHKNISLDCENPYSVARCYIKFVKEAPEYVFPTPSSFVKVIQGEYAMVDLGPENFGDNSVMLVTFDLQSNDDVMSIIEKLNHVYTFGLKGKIRVTAGPRKLLPGKAYKGKLVERRTKYFQIHHKTSENVVINFESPYSSCRLFVAKGVNSRATNAINLASSAMFQEKTVVITPQMLRTGEPITGHYSLSVVCYSSSSYRILYKPSSAENYEIRINDPIKIDLYPEDRNYVEFLNYGPAEDIEIEFRAPKAGVTLLVTAFNHKTMALAGEDKENDFKAPMLPSEEVYDFGSDVEIPMMGYGKLKIPKSSDKFCPYCRFVMLVKVTEADTVEIIVKKSSANWPIRVFEGEEQFAMLNTNETIYYLVEAMRLNEIVSATITLQSGHIAIDTSSAPFPNVTTATTWSADVMKGFARQAHFYREAEDKYSPAKMYLKIKAINESRITVNFAENMVRQRITKDTSYKATIGEGNTKLYTFETLDDEPVHLSFKVVGLGAFTPELVDDSWIKRTMTRGVVSVFMADSEIDVIQGRYYEVPTTLKINRDINRYEIKFVPSKKIAVIRIKNPQVLNLHYVLHYSTNAITYTKPRERIVSALHPFIPMQNYKIPVTLERSVLTLDIHECIDELVVMAMFSAAGRASVSSTIMFDKYVDARRLTLNDGPGTLDLYFFMRDAYDGKAALSFVEAKARSKPLSTVFSFTYDISAPDDPDVIGIERFKIRNEVGEVQVHDLSGDISVKKVMIDGIDDLLKNHKIQVVYSLVLAKNAGMLNHLVRCGKYGIADAKQFYNTDDYYVLNVYDHISAQLLADQKRQESEQKYFKIDTSNEIVLSPSLYSFGDRYEAAIVARVLVYGLNDGRTFPDGQEFTLIYERFVYGGNSAGFALTALMVLLVLLFIFVLVWKCLKLGLFRPLMNRGWFKSFDLDSIADQLVLEVSDYTKDKRKRADDSTVTLGSPSDSRDQSALDTSISEADKKADDAL